MFDMIHTEQWVPGAIATPNPIDLPSLAPGIDAIISAEIVRLGAGFTVPDHDPADIVATLDNHLPAAVAAAATHPPADVVASVANHAAHGHDITTVAPAGGGFAVTEPAAAGGLETADVAGAVNVGAVDVLAAAQAHAAGGAALAHTAGAAVAHVASAVPVVHAAVVGADPIVAVTATKVDYNTFTLNANVLAGDILRLRYIREGARLRVA